MNPRATSEVSSAAGPFLKWAGGKARLITQYAPFFPATYRRYCEPFLGGGAVFFYLRHHNSRLADLNEELIDTYRSVRDRVETLIRLLATYRNDPEFFYEVRARDTAELAPVERAARFIYLNRTCYNGLYRVNRDGRFNVPYGKYKNPTICDTAGLRAASLALQRVELLCHGFEQSTADLVAGDFVYFDPPYAPVSATARFTEYGRDGFGEAEQRRLAAIYRKLDARGCKLMLSNSSAPLVRELYGDFRMYEIQARRAINSNPTRRGPVTELLVLNYDPDQ